MNDGHDGILLVEDLRTVSERRHHQPLHGDTAVVGADSEAPRASFVQEEGGGWLILLMYPRLAKVSRGSSIVPHLLGKSLGIVGKRVQTPPWLAAVSTMPTSRGWSGQLLSPDK